MFKSERVTISVEAVCLRAAVVRGRQILRGDSEPLPQDVVKNGQVMDTAVFVQTLARLLKKLNAPRKRAVVSLGGQGAMVRILNLPNVPDRMQGEAVRREARRELPLPLDELYLSWQALPRQNGRAPSSLSVLTVSVPRLALDSNMTALRQAGVRPSVMDLKPLALVRAANHPDVVLADLDGSSGSVILVRDFVPYIVRSVVLPRTAAAEPADRADYMVSEIQRTLDFYRSTLAAAHTAWEPAVCLTGDLGEEEAVKARVAGQWPLLNPSPPLNLPDNLPLLPYLVNVGLAMKKE